MKIGNKYQLTSDSLNVTLSEKRKVTKGKNAGKTYWKSIFFYSSTKEALIGLVDMKVKETGLKDLRTITKRQDELYTLIQGITKTSQPCVGAVE